MGPLLLIAAKDLRQRVRDRSLFLLALVVPFGLAAIFSVVFSGVDRQETATFAVADQDGEQIARTFTEQVLAPLERQRVLRLRTAATEQEARDLIARGQARAAYVIPAGFSRAVLSGRPATLRVIGDANAPIGSFVARSVADAFAAEVRYVQVALAVRGGGSPQEAAAVPAPVTLEDLTAERRQLSLAESFSAGIAVFFLFFTVQFGFSSILDERRDGTLARLLAAPVPRATIAFGKLLSGVVVGVMSMTVLVIASSLLLGARWGHPLGVGLLVVAGVLAATGVMALVATVARSTDQAQNGQAVVAVLLGVLGGVFIPFQQMGEVFVTLSLLTPHRWFLQGLADLHGEHAPVLAPVPTLALLGFAAVTTAIALTRLGRMLRA
ncbi:ABC transporter permease [Nonomuraea fuscirosea]|uniref:ABC-2 type transport system permease protein n=1 Tax=Nonomuraea fuscirosea TaxID=1291556 RepID=A0A2T0NB52_9ACTN|nr:ABC transporter permease [Nonomuraea fuscirosea]PRX70170.1 ABC-2 type transport system permease protein [Nonomuraea fuscirosea]